MLGPLGISHVRMGSGTSWMPDSSPMHATHAIWGNWIAMIHGVAFAQYDDQDSRRGDRQLGITDWEMLMLMRRVGSGMLHLHGMASLEPATIGAKGYPLLLQTGESYKGAPLHDRQHPHDFVVELAALFQQPDREANLAVELYGGLAGEPALGPVAFMHRPSAQNDPLAPLGHHWQDAPRTFPTAWSRPASTRGSGSSKDHGSTGASRTRTGGTSIFVHLTRIQGE